MTPPKPEQSVSDHVHAEHIAELDAVREWLVVNPDVPVETFFVGLMNKRYHVSPLEVVAVRLEHGRVAKALTRTGMPNTNIENEAEQS